MEEVSQKRNIEQMRQFYLIYSKAQTVSDLFTLSWSHYLKLMRIDDENERKFYEIEAHKNNWSIRELNRYNYFRVYYHIQATYLEDLILITNF